MWLPVWLLCLAAILVGISSEERSDKRIVCYYTNWSVYRPGTAKFSPQNINPYLCTHLVYAFGGLTKDNALKPFDKYQDIEQGGYAKFNGLKTYNKNLKTMVAIGGWNEGSARFSPLVADSERRRELVKNTVKFLRQNHFDGLDLDWEYPSFRDGGKPRDRENYAHLVQELREEFDKESQKTGRSRLLLTMAVPAGIEYIDKGYDVQKLNKYLDWMNILSYDYHSAFEPSINHHSPLFSLEEDDEYNFDAQLNIDHTVEHYLKLGAEKNKLVVGIPTYGRSYTLFNPDATEIGSPADGPGEQGEATREKGYLAYYEICERISDGGWTVKNTNPKAMGPYAFKGNQWVGYDDEEIARAKARYVNEKELGGIMFWSIDNDDFRGRCHGKPYPLIEAAKEALLADSNELVPTRQNKHEKESRTNSRKHESETTSRPKSRKTRPRGKTSTTTTTTEEVITKKTPAYSTTTPLPPTTPDPGSDFVCKDEGFFPHPRDCKKYFWCLDSGPSSLGIVAHQFTCPSGLVFNKISDSCDYPRNVICKNKVAETPSPTTTTTAGTTTARNKHVITASPPRSTTARSTTTTTTTTTEEPEEYEEYDEDEEEDPKTIKELITLIKKLGGVEELEKQLNIQDPEENKKIKPSLYNKVLNSRTGNRYRGASEELTTSKYTSLFRNRPIPGQNSQSEEEVSSGSKHHEKPQYVTIHRNRPSTKAPKESEEEEEEVESEEEEVKETSTPSRRRPGSNASTEKEYVTFRRARPQNEESSTPRYKTIHRSRSTTEASVEESEEEASDEIEEDTEPVQKSKKYSSVIRDNKRIVSEVEDSKVSGRQGPQFEKEETTTVTHFIRTTVNNVYKGSTPKYVEIRRGNSKLETETTTNDVNSVNNSDESQEKEETSATKIEEKATTVFESTPKSIETTTEVIRRRTRFPLRQIPTSTTERTTTTTTEDSKTKNSDLIRKRGRFRLTTETAPPSDVSIETPNRFRVNQRNRTRKPVESSEETTKPVETVRRRGGSFRFSTTEANSQPSSEETPKRFQFASRSKPKILTPTAKPPKEKEEEFTIIVPDGNSPTTLDYSTTDDEAMTITTELDTTITMTEPTVIDVTTLDYTETNLPVTSFQRRKVSKLKKTTVPISTSTETSVVTSVTESLITERAKISITKKPHFKTAYDKLKSKTSTTTPTTPQIVEQSTAASRHIRLQKYNKKASTSTTPKTEIRGRNYNGRFAARSSTVAPVTTSTETTSRFTPKRGRGFKKFSDASSNENAELASSERTNRFRPQTKVRQSSSSKSLDNNLLLKRTGEFPGRVSSSKNKDDLETQQSSAFYEDDADDVEEDQNFFIGETIRQTSGNEYLKADVLFATVPTVEEEEKQVLEEKKSTLVDSKEPKPDLSTASPQTSSSDRHLRGKSRKGTDGSNEKTDDRSRSRIYRGRIRAKDSLRDNVSNELLESTAVTKNLEKSRVTFRSRVTEPTPSSEADYGSSSESEAQTEASSTTTPKPTTALFRRGGSQDYLTNLRSRTRTTTTTSTTTERPARRPGVQLDRRRKFRPDVRTTPKSELLTEGTSSNATRGFAFQRRRLRPTTEATSANVQREDSNVEETKENKEAPDLPELADPAVVAIHNLATVSPGPVSPSVATTPIRVASDPPSTFTIQVSPVTETSVLTASLAAFSQVPGITAGEPAALVSSRPFSNSPITRHFSTTGLPSPTTQSTFSISRGTPEPVIKARSEVVIQPRRQETSTTQSVSQAPRKLKPFSKVPKPGIVQAVSRPNSPPIDYEFYDDADVVDDPLAEVPPSALKVKVHSDGYIECLDRGNFPHPFSCKKFISCAKMENNELLGWEYTCPKHLSFDPVGGICNWSAGLGCQH